MWAFIFVFVNEMIKTKTDKSIDIDIYIDKNNTRPKISNKAEEIFPVSLSSFCQNCKSEMQFYDLFGNPLLLHCPKCKDYDPKLTKDRIIEIDLLFLEFLKISKWNGNCDIK